MKLKFKLACLICVFAIPVILSSCKESIDVEEIASPNLSQGIKPSDKEIEEFKNWYSDLESNPNARTGAKDGMDEIQEVELWKKAKSHKQEKASNKLMTLPLIDFKEKGKTKVKQLYLTEIDGKKSGYKLEIKSSNGKSDKFTGTVTITSLDEKSKREYKYKDNKLESKKNSRVADFDNVELPEVIVTASVFHNGSWYLVQLQFNANMNPYVMFASVDPYDPLAGGTYSIDPEYDPELVYEVILAISEKLAEIGKILNQAEKNILNRMSTSDIIKFYNNYLVATKLTDRMWSGTLGSLDGFNHPNAFKHTLFAAYHAQDFGASVALQLTNAHEAGRTGCDTQMDLLNNVIGINLGSSFTGNSNELIMTIYNMAKYGELWTLGGTCVHKVPF
jgi:hypothetical protein